MSFLKSIFKQKEKPINTYSDFWIWFAENKNIFHEVVKNQGDINKVFFDKLSPKLQQLKDGIWFLTGMLDDVTAELILTADGEIKNIFFIEELVESAPSMNNWKITAHKQPKALNDFGIEMDGYKFDKSNMNFYSIDHESMPDEIDLIITHNDYKEENRSLIINGVFLTIDNSLGELNAIANIDNMNVISPSEAKEKLIPIEKLNDFLIWREKEFVEKYKGVRHDTADDSYSMLEATLKNGFPMNAIINMQLLNWDGIASHPWIVVVDIRYDGRANMGLPDEQTYELLNEIEDKLITELKDSDGYLNIGRQTADSSREIYFACIDFRLPSKILFNLKNEYQQKIELDFDIFKDKYWQTFNKFRTN